MTRSPSSVQHSRKANHLVFENEQLSISKRGHVSIFISNIDNKEVAVDELIELCETDSDRRGKLVSVRWDNRTSIAFAEYTRLEAACDRCEKLDGLTIGKFRIKAVLSDRTIQRLSDRIAHLKLKDLTLINYNQTNVRFSHDDHDSLMSDLNEAIKQGAVENMLFLDDREAADVLSYGMSHIHFSLAQRDHTNKTESQGQSPRRNEV